MDLLMPSTGLLFWMTLVFLIVLLIQPEKSSRGIRET